MRGNSARRPEQLVIWSDRRECASAFLYQYLAAAGLSTAEVGCGIRFCVVLHIISAGLATNMAVLFAICSLVRSQDLSTMSDPPKVT